MQRLLLTLTIISAFIATSTGTRIMTSSLTSTVSAKSSSMSMAGAAPEHGGGNGSNGGSGLPSSGFFNVRRRERQQEVSAESPRLLQEAGTSSSSSSSTSAGNFTTSRDDNDSSDDRSSNNRSPGGGGVQGPSKRNCLIEQTSGRVEFECEASQEDGLSEIEDELTFKIQANRGNFLTIDVEYETEIEDVVTDAETETETKYTLVYDRIIEYRKVGSATDNHYEWGVDEIVNTWTLDGWEELTPVETDGNLLTFSATDGVASFMFTIAQVDSSDLTANKMKIDFLLENYPWDASGDTFVALVSHVRSERETKVESGDDDDDEDTVEDVLIDFEDAAKAVGFIPVGEYSWAKTAEAFTFDGSMGTNATDMDVVDGSVQVERMASNMTADGTTSGTTIDVIASTSPNVETGDGKPYKEIAFSFVGAAQGADRIYWDPEAGVGYQSPSSDGAGSGAARFLLGSIWAVMATSAVSALLVVGY